MQYSGLLEVCLLLCIAHTGLAATDVAVAWTSMEATYNPSLVEYGGTYLSALKRTTFARGKGKTFWVNHLYICVGANTDLAGLRCRQYYPWTEKYHECEFDKRVRGGKVDVTGLGDVKVWVWPGKGVYAIFGRKPERTPGGGPYCTSQVVYDQWIAQVRPEATAGEWRLSQPLRLYAQGFNYSPSEPFIMEKNWMPWVYKDNDGVEHLHVTHMVEPHRIFEVQTSGACVMRHETKGDPKLFDKFKTFSVHGGPPVIYVNASASGSGKPYYLGIMHHIEKYGAKKVKVYRHFAYKFDPEPPFAITAISDELRLTFFRDSKYPTKHFIIYVSGLFLGEGNKVYVSYGAGDREPRVMTMDLKELEATFTGKMEFLHHEKLPE